MQDQIAVTLITVVLILVVFGALVVVLTMNAKPKGKDLAFLTAGAGEQVLAYRVVNACLKEAAPNAFFNFVMDKLGAQTATDLAFATIKSMSGGLWVGGRAFLTTHRLVFMPNAMNRAVHEALPVIAIDLAAVTDVADRFGVGTRILDVKTAQGDLTLRGYDSARFAGMIKEAVLTRRRG
jgi:hypothetical protein